MDDELHDRLQDLGADTGPPPDPAFSARLEADLRSHAYFTPRDRAHAAPRRVAILRPGMVLGALLLIALAAVLVVSQGGDDPDVLVIENGLGATVTLPDGATVAGGTGVELPDGAVIEIAVDGFALVDGIVLPAGSMATVVNGVLELSELPAALLPTATPTPTPQPTATAEPPADPTPTSRPAATPAPTEQPTEPATPEPTAPPAPTTTPRPTPTPSPRPDRTPDDRPSPSPTATAAATATATPEPTVADTVPEITLSRENLGPRRAQLSWSVTTPDGIRGFEVRVRRGDTVRTAAVLRSSDARALTVERPERDRVFYRVLAIGRDGQVVARSNEVRVTSPTG